MNTGTHASRHRPRAAFTLIEMIVSLSIISLVFLAMGSVMLLSAKALPTADDASTLTYNTLDVTRQMTSELQTAVSLIETTDRSITFTIPDRDEDGDTEELTYTWSGNAGDPLVRTYNGGTPVNVLASVQSLSLDYDIRSIPQPDIIEESDEIILDSLGSSQAFNEFPITQYNWLGQSITPENLPDDALEWNVSRVLFQAKRHSSNTGVTEVQLRTATSSGYPTSTVLESILMYESLLGSDYAWVEAPYSSVQGLAPSDKLCLVMVWQAGNEAAGIRYSSSHGQGLLVSYTKGSSWGYGNSSSLTYYVYGTYTYGVPQPPLEVLGSVSLTVNPSTLASTQVRSQVLAFNQPEMP